MDFLGKISIILVCYISLHTNSTYAHNDDEVAKKSSLDDICEMVERGLPQEMPNSDIPTKHSKIQLKWKEFTVKHAMRTLSFSFCSSLAIFIIVIFIICFALFLTWRQFNQTGKSSETHVLKIGKDGIYAESSVIGFLVLLISLVFFFLYLIHVYPISFIETNSDHDVVESTNK